MHKIFFIIIFLILPFNVFAEKLDVTVDVPSGTYHSPIRITLSPTDPSAKTFYSFKPDGYPNDAFLYTGTILLKHSSPFIYFSFSSTSNESKIKQNDYIIEYPSTIHFVADSFSGSGNIDIMLVNSGSESVDIGHWIIQSESEMVTIPDGTVIAPGAQYGVGINYTGTSPVVLRSPDDDERDILIFQNVMEDTTVVTSKKKGIITKTVPRKIISTREIAPEIIKSLNENVSTIPPVPSILPATTQATDIPQTPSFDQPRSVASGITAPAVGNINQMVKVSASESGQKNTNPLYFVALLVISMGIGGFQWFVRRKQK